MTMNDSPWSGPEVVFKKIPKINPKTGNDYEFFMCSVCGASVANRRIHIAWHEDLSHRSITGF